MIPYIRIISVLLYLISQTTLEQFSKILITPTLTKKHFVLVCGHEKHLHLYKN